MGIIACDARIIKIAAVGALDDIRDHEVPVGDTRSRAGLELVKIELRVAALFRGVVKRRRAREKGYLVQAPVDAYA